MPLSSTSVSLGRSDLFTGSRGVSFGSFSFKTPEMHARCESTYGRDVEKSVSGRPSSIRRMVKIFSLTLKALLAGAFSSYKQGISNG